MTEPHSNEHVGLVSLLSAHRTTGEEPIPEWTRCSCGEAVWSFSDHLAALLSDHVAERVAQAKVEALEEAGASLPVWQSVNDAQVYDWLIDRAGSIRGGEVTS